MGAFGALGVRICCNGCVELLAGPFGMQTMRAISRLFFVPRGGSSHGDAVPQRVRRSRVALAGKAVAASPAFARSSAYGT